MAGYVFESITDAQAASFGTGDYLFFSTSGSTANQVSVTPFTSSSGVLSGSGITLTYGGVSHTFNNSISTASTAGHILFQDNSHLLIGTTGNETLTPATASNAGTTPNNDPYTVYALSGADTINFSSAAIGSAEYLNGGFGADSINGGNANSHIYGNSQFSQQGDTQNGQIDGGDTITVGSGSNYINGNAGADTITAGTNATTGVNATAATAGFNRIFGGADNDTINIAGAGHNAVNGNTSNDTITDTGTGDNTLRGGSGDDVIVGGSGHSVLMGDIGNDTITIHGSNGESATTKQHIDVITGGDGSDTFNFSNAGAGQAALFGGNTVYYQEITDFTVGTDKLTLPTGVEPSSGGTTVGHSSTIFASVHDAEVYAQSQLSGGGNAAGTPSVEALSVGSTSSTYLFYTESGNTAANSSEVAGLGVIHLDNVTASAITYTSFT